jgi:hypothetical protein
MEKLLKRAFVVATAAAIIPALAGAATVSEPVRSIDNIPPVSVTNLRALDGENGVFLTWALSVDDAVSFAPFGDTFVPRGGVQGYNVYRESSELGEELVTSLLPGTAQYTDITAAGGVTYIYSVRPFDADNETNLDVIPGSVDDLGRIIARGGPPSVVVVVTVKGSLTFDVELDFADATVIDAFEADFISLVSQQLGISADRVRIIEIRPGSVIVDFEILDPPEGVVEPTADEALASLIVLVADPETDEFATLAPVLTITDETTSDAVVIPQPLDLNGNLVLGWFTRGGDKVGFDDFFQLADNFGRTSADESWDPRFDIIPNDAVDFDDFFRFADDFGRTVANAAEIQGLLGN